MCPTALYMLAYGTLRDAIDECVKPKESIALEAIKQWIRAIHSCFGDTYFRQPTRVDIKRQIQINTE